MSETGPGVTPHCVWQTEGRTGSKLCSGGEREVKL